MANLISNIYDQDDKFDQLVNVTQEQLLDGISTSLKGFSLSFSETRTKRTLLTNLFIKQFNEVNEQAGGDASKLNLLKLYITSQRFISKLEQSNLYKNVNVIWLPGQERDNAWMHFQIVDKSPFFFSLTNEFERDGSAILSFKSGYKNFLRRQDILQFEFEKGLNRAGWNWILNWNYKDIIENRYSIDLKQSNHNIHPLVEESKKEIQLKYESIEGVQYTLSNQVRANRINKVKESSLAEQFLYNQHLNHLDFLPSSSFSLNILKPLYNNIDEAQTSNVLKGSSCQLNSTIGLPFLSSNPFLRFQLSHQFHFPVHPYRNYFNNHSTLKRIIKNSSFQLSLNYGLSISNNLMINDTFQNLQFRGYGQVVNGHEVSYQPRRRIMDTFAKADLKFNIYNHEHLKKQNINMFYYLSLFSLHTHSLDDQLLRKMRDNIRISSGIGIGIPLSREMQLEALVGLVHYGAQKFDKPNVVQLRLAMND